MPQTPRSMEDLIEFIIGVLFCPYFWWHNHNENSRLGTSRDEEEAEQFWLKFAVWGTMVVAVAFGLWYLLHRSSLLPAA